MGEGAVKSASVIHVLETALIDMGVSFQAKDGIVTIVKDGVPMVHPLPELVTRKMVARFSTKYKIPMEWFYHPEMLVKGSGRKN